MSKGQSISKQSFFTITEGRLELAEEIIIILADSLNKIHQTNYSERFWRIIIAPYVSTVLTSRKILEEENINIKPSNILFANTLELEKSAIFFSRFRYLIKISKSIFGLKKIKKQLRRSRNIAMGHNYSEGMSPKMDAYMEAYHPFITNKKVNSKLRNIIPQQSENFSRIFIENMIKVIPKIYVENFDHLINIIPLINSKEKIFHVATFHSQFMRFIVAKYIENGAQLYFYQHGGFYGEYKYHTAHHFESNIADKFMTWGWKINANDVPSPAYRLEKFRNSYINYKIKLSDILIIYPIIRNQNSNYVKDASRFFFNNIRREKFPIIYARPRPIAKFNRKSILNFISTDVDKIDSGFSNISNLISKSRLVIIFTHPSTTLLECLYVDHPTVAIIDNDNISTEVVKPHYDFLLKMGLFHNSMDSLVNHLNTVDIDLWWNDLIVHPKYLQFKHEFLRKVS